MIFKLLGGFLIFSASSGLGLLLSSRYSSRPRDLRAFRRVLQMLETEIIFGATPLPAALFNVSTRSENSAKYFLEQTADLLTQRTFFSAGEAWSQSVEKVLRKSALISSDLELIKSFGNVLGYSDREDQQKHFALLYVQLKQQEDMAEEERKRNARMYKSLGFLFGAAVFVILV